MAMEFGKTLKDVIIIIIIIIIKYQDGILASVLYLLIVRFSADDNVLALWPAAVRIVDTVLPLLHISEDDL